MVGCGGGRVGRLDGFEVVDDLGYVLESGWRTEAEAADRSPHDCGVFGELDVVEFEGGECDR